MCSIGGFVSEKPLDPQMARNLMRALLWYGRSRGQQSAGVFYADEVVKRAHDPKSFIDSSDFHNLFAKGSTIGLTHTRQPSSGGFTDFHAQPFRVGDVVTIHNGMITNPQELKGRWNLEKLSNVDSELYTSFLAHFGTKKLPEFMEATEGCSAVAAVVDGQVWLMRSGNPTFYTRLVMEDNLVTVFASTEEQLVSSCQHAWLLPITTHVQGTEQHRLLKVMPGYMEGVGRKIRPVSFCQSNYGYGGWDEEHNLWRGCSGYRRGYREVEEVVEREGVRYLPPYKRGILD